MNSMKTSSQIHFPSLEDIRNYTWKGNHHHDAEAFIAVDTFVRNTRILAEQAEAIRIMQDKGMGFGRAEYIPNRELVDEYLNQ